MTRPLAGTRPRGKTPAEDAQLEHELRNDEKERAEHIMLVDLGRNDIGRVSEPGTVKVSELMDVERYSHVMHLVTHVQGKLKKEPDGFRCFTGLLPGRNGRPARPKSGRWKSSPNLSRKSGDLMPELAAIFLFPEIWTWPSPSALSS